MHRLLVFLTLLGLFPQSASADRIHRHARAAFTISAVAEGPDGLLYVAGELGLYRYDGFRFVAVPGYPFRQAQHLAVTSDTALWVGSTDQGVTRYQPATGFQMTTLRPVDSMVALGDRLFSDLYDGHILRIDRSGNPREVKTPDRCVGLHRTPQQQLWNRCGNQTLRLDPDTMALTPVEGAPVLDSGEALPDHQGRIWLSNSAGAFRLGSEEALERTQSRSRRGSFLQGRSQLWYHDGSRITGLSPKVEIPIEGLRRVVFETSDSRMWVAANDGTLWELAPDSQWQTWLATDLDDAPPLQLLRNAAGELVLVTERHLLVQAGAKWKRISEESHDFEYVLPLADGGYLAAVGNRTAGTKEVRGILRLNRQGMLSEHIAGSDSTSIADDFREMAVDQGGRTFLCNKSEFFELTDHGLVPLPLPRDPEERIAGRYSLSNAVDLERDLQGKLWVGYAHGLASLQSNGSWERFAVTPPLHNVRSFAFRGPKEIWVAHRVKGYFSRVDSGQVTRLKQEDGYGPDSTAFVKVDRRGWIWRGTEEGIYVSDGKRTGPQDWLYFDAGGASRQYGLFEDRDGSLWIAAQNGVTHVSPSADWFRDKPGRPRISRLLVNGQEYRTPPAVLDPPPADLSIEFSRLGTPERPQPFQYRLLPISEQWRTAKDGRIELRDLQPDQYRLEVRQLGLASTLVQEFRIGPVPFWQSWWLLLPLPVFAGWSVWRRERLAYRWRKTIFLIRRRWLGPNDRDDSTDDLSGAVLKGRYRILGCLSWGGFSHIYEAIDEPSGTRVVVKVLDHRIADASWVRARFAQEVAALHSVRHPGVIQILDSWIQPTGEACIVMPLIDGPTLREASSSAKFSPTRIGELMIQLAEALSSLHQAGVIHRDLKPENILLSETGPVLIDLGASGLLGTSEGPAMTKMLKGSIEYLAPERLTGQYSPASDVYALGAMLFELISGTKLIESQITATQEALHRTLKVSPVLAELMASALHFLPDQRPTDISAWAQRVANELRNS